MFLMNKAPPGPREGDSCAGLCGDAGEGSPEGHLVQGGQLGEVGVHQADGLQEAAVLGCGHRGQVRFQKRTQSCEWRTPSQVSPTWACRLGHECRCQGGGTKACRELGPDSCHRAAAQALSPIISHTGLWVAQF